MSNIQRMINAKEKIWMKKYFEGKWLFKRTIYNNNKESTYGIADGVAYFTSADKEKLIYNEEGKLSLISTGQQFTFSRSFIYVFEGDQVEILFNDGANLGQLYQSYKLDANSKVLISNAQHICKDDAYNGIYSIISSNEYKLETFIKGLNKEFKIETYAIRA